MAGTRYGNDERPTTVYTEDRSTSSAPAPPLPHATEFVTAQTDPPKVVARDRAILPAILVFLITLTGGPVVTLMPIADEWKAAIGLVFVALNGALVYYNRAIVEGDKDQARAERL